MIIQNNDMPIQHHVLDHGYVRLVDYIGNDQRICDAARVSHGRDKADHTQDRNRKLIKYLWDHQHGTPFEHVVFTFEVQLPIFVMRQLVRHRIASINEISARYTELPELAYVPEPTNIGVQSETNHQGRDMGAPNAAAAETIRAATEAAFEVYRGLLADGVPREVARVVLPVNVYTRIYWTINLRSLANFLTLRLDSHAQWEIQQYAQAIRDAIAPHVPMALEAMGLLEEAEK